MLSRSAWQVAACSHRRHHLPFQNLTATGCSAHWKHYQYRTQPHRESLLQHSQMTWPTKRPGSHYQCYCESKKKIPTFPLYSFKLPLRGSLFVQAHVSESTKASKRTLDAELKETRVAKYPSDTWHLKCLLNLEQIYRGKYLLLYVTEMITHLW